MVEEPAHGGVPPLQTPLRWNRAHFGAWAVSSSPLVIGADISDTALMAKVGPIISNTEAIAINQAWSGHPGRLVGGSGYEGKYPVVQDCQSSDATQQGWSYDATSGTIRGPGGLCLDNRTIGTYKGAPIPSQENNQFQLKPCDGSDFQRFYYNTSGMPPPPPSSLSSMPGATASSPPLDTETWGILYSNTVPQGPSNRTNQPDACSDGVGMTGPCCVKTNGWCAPVHPCPDLPVVYAWPAIGAASLSPSSLTAPFCYLCCCCC